MRLSTCSLPLIFCLCFFSRSGQAQNMPFKITGKIIDASDGTPLVGVNVVLISRRDTNQRVGMGTDPEGGFRTGRPDPGSYLLRATYIGYKPLEMNVRVNQPEKDLGTLGLQPDVTELQGVVVEGRLIRVEQKGDTAQYNAGAFKTNPDASAEELVTKMPGISLESGAVKAQGEDVQRVLVDGREFFGDDATLALRNLPAEIIDKVQVFDRQSDQAQFTGFDDGQTQKTINIVTKPGKNSGQFGKIYAGYGTGDRYSVGGNINFFKGQRRITLVGLSNNVNQQNFSSQDLLGITGTISQGQGGRGAAVTAAAGVVVAPLREAAPVIFSSGSRGASVPRIPTG